MALHAARQQQQQQQLMLLVGKRNKNRGEKNHHSAPVITFVRRKGGGLLLLLNKINTEIPAVYSRTLQNSCCIAQTHRLFLALIARATGHHCPTPATGGANEANAPLPAEDVVWVHQLRLFAILSPSSRCSLCFRDRLESSDRCLPHMRS